jgi:L(+)-tartrate dehydratase beta subunit
VVYPTGTLVTCRDVDHRHSIELGRQLPVDLKGDAIFHARPIVRQKEDGEYEMVSIGPTTSIQIEKFGKAFIEQTGVKLIVGKGCMENKAVSNEKKKPILERINAQIRFIK